MALWAIITEMDAHTLSIIGLLLNMLATVLLFFFGFPQPNHEEGVYLDIGEKTVFNDGTSVKSINERIRRRRLLYRVMSSIALLMMFAGFGCQFLAIL